MIATRAYAHFTRDKFNLAQFAHLVPNVGFEKNPAEHLSGSCIIVGRFRIPSIDWRSS
jgi:hypothetical protein